MKSPAMTESLYMQPFCSDYKSLGSEIDKARNGLVQTYVTDLPKQSNPSQALRPAEAGLLLNPRNNRVSVGVRCKSFRLDYL